MTTPITASYGTITLKAIGNLPARLLGGAGIDVTPTSGFAYRVDMDIAELPVSPLGAAAGKFTAVWDSVSNTLMRIEFTQLPAPNVDWSVITSKPSTFPPTLPIAESGVTNLVADLAARPTEAPSDGHTYGRKNGAWADVAAGVVITVHWTDIVGTPSTFPPSPHTHVESDVTGLVADLAATEKTANKGAVNGYAALDATGKVPAGQLPAPAVGEAPNDGKVYGRGTLAWQNLTDNFTAKTGPTGASNTPAGTTAQRPANTAGLIRFNTDTGTFEGNNGSAWSGIGGGVYVGTTAPPSPAPGALWWKSDSGLLLLYYQDVDSFQWVVATPSQDLGSLDGRYKQISDGGVFKVSSGVLGAAVGNLDIALPSGYTSFELMLAGIYPTTDGQTLNARFSYDGGATFLVANYGYSLNTSNTVGANTPAGATGQVAILCTSSQSNVGASRGSLKFTIPVSDPGGMQSMWFDGFFQTGAGGAYNRISGMGAQIGAAGRANALRFLYGTGNISAGLIWQLNGMK